MADNQKAAFTTEVSAAGAKEGGDSFLDMFIGFRFPRALNRSPDCHDRAPLQRGLSKRLSSLLSLFSLFISRRKPIMSTKSDLFSYTSLQKQFGQGIPCPADYSFPSHMLDEWTRKQPNQTALHWVAHDYSKEKIVTYAQLSDLSHRAAIAFSQKGIKKVSSHDPTVSVKKYLVFNLILSCIQGDRVMVQLPRVNEFWVQLFGLMRIGAVPCPGTTLLMSKGERITQEQSDMSKALSSHLEKPVERSEIERDVAKAIQGT